MTNITALYNNSLIPKYDKSRQSPKVGTRALNRYGHNKPVIIPVHAVIVPKWLRTWFSVYLIKSSHLEGKVDCGNVEKWKKDKWNCLFCLEPNCQKP